MTLIEVFVISFLGSFAGTLTVFVGEYWLHKRQLEQIDKMKKSLQNTVSRIKGELKEKEVVSWLAGLISTDGTIFAQTNQKGCRVKVVITIDEKWAEKVQSMLSRINLKSKIYSRSNESGSFKNSKKIYSVHLFVPSQIKLFKLFRKYNCKKYFMERKWALIEKFLAFYESEEYKEHRRWTQEEEKRLIQLCKKHPNASDVELGKKLSKPKSSISSKRYELGISSSWIRRKAKNAVRRLKKELSAK